MKNLKDVILEKLKIRAVPKFFLRPKTKEELVDFIISEIEVHGPNCSLNHIDVVNIDDMSYLFRGGSDRQYDDGHPILSTFDGDISMWDVSNVTDMSFMFSGATSFDQNLLSWKPRKYGVNTKDMFHNCPQDDYAKPQFY